MYYDKWNHNLETIRVFFGRLSETKMRINLSKRDCHANLTFLGHVVDQGQVKSVEAKVLWVFFFFVCLFYLGFTALSRIFHLYRADRSSKVGENRKTRGKPPDRP